MKKILFAPFVGLVVLLLVATAPQAQQPQAQQYGEKGDTELAKAVSGAKVSLVKGLAASTREGNPISAKFELEHGVLQLSVYTESWRTPCSSSNFAEIGLPSRVLAARPFTSETLAPLTAFASSVSPFSPYCWAWGCWAWGAVATSRRTTRPTNGANRIFFIASPSAQ